MSSTILYVHPRSRRITVNDQLKLILKTDPFKGGEVPLSAVVFEDFRHKNLTKLNVNPGDIVVISSVEVMSKNMQDYFLAMKSILDKKGKIVFAKEKITLTSEDEYFFVDLKKQNDEYLAGIGKKISSANGDGKKKIYSDELKKQAYDLRKQGYTMKQISVTLKIPLETSRYLYSHYESEDKAA